MKTVGKSVTKPVSKVPVKVEPVEQPPTKVTEAVSEGLSAADAQIAKEVHESDSRVHHVANAGE